MGGLQEWKKKAVQVPGQKAGSGLEKTVRKQLAAAVGADYFDNRDPVRHITEDFQKTFDLMGSRKARERSGMLFETEMKQIVPGLSENRKDQEQPAGLQAGTPGGDWSQIAQQRGRESFLEQSSMGDMVEPTDEPGQQMFLSRFAQVAFNRGTLAGAVLRGTGKMMLFSCLKRTAGQSQPMNLRQRKLFEGSSQRRNVTVAARARWQTARVPCQI